MMDDARLHNALKHAELGWRLFPAHYRDGNHIGCVKWGTESSSDPDVIRSWAERWPAAHFCVNLRASDLSVVDVDDKNGKTGSIELETLSILYGALPDTYQSTTPSGGMHYIYKGACAVGANKIARGVDSAVMIPIPGSMVEGKGEYRVVRNGYVSPLPGWVRDIAGAAPEHKSTDRDAAAENIDSDRNVSAAVSYLLDAGPAIEGDGGDYHTYKVACKVRGIGISQDKCLELLLDYWNDSCLPPWSPDELETKIHNAYSYAQSDIIGADSPDAIFSEPVDEKAVRRLGGIKKDPMAAALDISPDIPGLPQQQSYDLSFRPLSDVLKDAAAPVWVVKGFFERDTINLLYGESGAMKSFLAINLGMHVALGDEWAGRKVDGGPVFYLAGEGLGGMARRIKAFRRAYKGDKDVSSAPFFLASRPVQLDTKVGALEVINAVKTMADAHGIPKMVVIDTLATSFGGGDENSTKDMTTYLSHVAAIRTAFRCAVLLVHHTSHAVKDRPRGAYALIAGVDNSFQVERDDYIRDNVRSMAVVMRSPKKMKDWVAPPDTWFRAKPVDIGVDEDLQPVTSISLEFNAEASAEAETAANKPPKEQLSDKIKSLVAMNSPLEYKALVDVLKTNGVTKHSIDRALKKLIGKGVISADDPEDIKTLYAMDKGG